MPKKKDITYCEIEHHNGLAFIWKIDIEHGRTRTLIGHIAGQELIDLVINDPRLIKEGYQICLSK